MACLWSKTFLSWEIQTSLLEEKSFKWPSFIIRFQGFREIPSKKFAKFLTEFDELHFREKFSFAILFDICRNQPSISKTVELLLHKHPYFSTFSDKMAADSLHFIIYCFNSEFVSSVHIFYKNAPWIFASEKHSLFDPAELLATSVEEVTNEDAEDDSTKDSGMLLFLSHSWKNLVKSKRYFEPLHFDEKK